MKLKNPFPPAPKYTLPNQSDVVIVDRGAASGSSSYLPTTNAPYPIPVDAIWPELEVQEGELETAYNFRYNKNHYRVAKSEWEPIYVDYQGRILPCFLYRGKTSGLQFFNYTLSGKEYKQKGKGKGRQ
jgi:hypothetical protein